MKGHYQALSGLIRTDADTTVLRPVTFATQFIYSLTKKPKTMLDKIAKNNKIMAIVSVATLAIVAYVLVYKPWKAKKDLGAE